MPETRTLPDPLLDPSDDATRLAQRWDQRYPFVEYWFKLHQSFLWPAEDIESELSLDRQQWTKDLNEAQRHFIRLILAFFATADGIVSENINANFADEVQLSCVRHYYGLQNYIEGVHAETYNILLENLVPRREDADRLIRAVSDLNDPQFSSVAAKRAWMERYMDRARPFRERLLAFIFVEGCFFQGSFLGIFYFQNKNLLPALCVANRFIARDENIHTRFAIDLYRALREQCEPEHVYELAREALQLEQQFAAQALQVELVGLKRELMCQYLEFVINGLLRDLGLEPLSQVTNPFPFMDQQGMQGKTNFFEQPEHNYADRRIKIPQRRLPPAVGSGDPVQAVGSGGGGGAQAVQHDDSSDSEYEF